MSVPRRPGFGTKGERIRLKTNAFPLQINTDSVYMYSVSFTPEVGGRIGYRIFSLIPNLKALGPHILDGLVLFLQRREPDFFHEVKFDGTNYTVSVTCVGPVKTTGSSDQVCRVMNTVIRRCFKDLKYVPVQLRFFDPKKNIRIDEHRVDIWPGFDFSVHPVMLGPTMLIDPATKVIRLETVYEKLREIKASPGPGTLAERANHALTRSIVMTRYNNRTYRIGAIDFTKTPRTMFESKQGPVSIAGYMKTRYGLTIKDLDQPLIVAEASRRGGSDPLLIPELCSFTGLTDQMRKDYRVMRDLSRIMALPPDQLINRIQGVRNDLSKTEVKKVLDEWGISINTTASVVEGRVLPIDPVEMKNKTQTPVHGDFSSITRDGQFVVGVEVADWVLVHTERDKQVVDGFIQKLMALSAKMKGQIKQPIVRMIPDDRTENYIRALESTLKPTYKLVMLVFPNPRADRYDTIKTFLTRRMPLPSQCILTKTISREQGLMSVCSKVLVQIQAKIGGQPWRVGPALPSTMIIGIDVYHDTVTRGASVLAFIASLNDSCTRYFSDVVFHRSGEEISRGTAVKECMTNALKMYHEVNKKLPQTIIIYRDGVGSGMVSYVHQHERPQIEAAFQNFVEYRMQPPRLTILLVLKRIQQRFFSETNTNPPVDTVIDTGVTSATGYDFYLLSTAPTVGTATPTHYSVIHDGSGMSADDLQRLTKRLCYLYFNWSGAVRVPAPCQYAHKLAYLVGQSIHEKPHSRLVPYLYYL